MYELIPNAPMSSVRRTGRHRSVPSTTAMGSISSSCTLRQPSGMSTNLAARFLRDRPRVDQVALAREESGMACLEDELLASLRLQHREVVVVHDPVSGHAVLDGAVRELE